MLMMCGSNVFFVSQFAFTNQQVQIAQCEPCALKNWSEYEEGSREPKLTAEIPRDWVTVEEDFVFVYAVRFGL